MTIPRRLLVLVVVMAIVVATTFRRPLSAFFHESGDAKILLLSGNIEAHESVLGVKTVRSRIIDLPFDEGASVTGGERLKHANLNDATNRLQGIPAQVF
jgi:HlyD family secretion protein